jgi:DNA-binding NtrC family response regulator
VQQPSAAADDRGVQTEHSALDIVRPGPHREMTRSLAIVPRRSRAAIYVRVEGLPTVRLQRDRPIVVGSHRSADIRLTDDYVSARHCRLCLVDDGVLVVDLGSKNGTFLDGVRVERVRVHAKAVLRVGEEHIHIDSPAGRPAASQAADASHSPTMPPSISMIGRGRAFRQLRSQLHRLAPLRQPVLLRGETGTGKELAAQALHDAGSRSGGPFVAINCASIVHGLAESMLFGHVRGAFSGAHRDHAGAFARAHGGTIFLDEVAELPLALQAKLLRAMETRCVTPVGAEREVHVDVRIVTATHRDLDAMVASGDFREDLFHRLSVLVVELPPLRERRADIPDLLTHFATLAAAELGRPVTLSPEAVTAAQAYDWPGNIRALRNAVLRAGALSDGIIEADALVPSMSNNTRAAPPGVGLLLPRGDYGSMNRELLRRAVHEHDSIRQAAKALGVPRSTLGAWLKKLGIAIPARPPRASSRAPAPERESRTALRPSVQTARVAPR